jgi:hypothetical protein
VVSKGNRLKQPWIDWLFRRNYQNCEAKLRSSSSPSHRDCADDLGTQVLPSRPSRSACLLRRWSDCRLRHALHDLRVHGEFCLPFTFSIPIDFMPQNCSEKCWKRLPYKNSRNRLPDQRRNRVWGNEMLCHFTCHKTVPQISGRSIILSPVKVFIHWL